MSICCSSVLLFFAREKRTLPRPIATSLPEKEPNAFFLTSRILGGKPSAKRRPCCPAAGEPFRLAGAPVGAGAVALRHASAMPNPVARRRTWTEPQHQQPTAGAAHAQARADASERNAYWSSWCVCRGDRGCCCAGIGGRVRAVRARSARQPGTARALRGITVRSGPFDQAASRPGSRLARHSLLSHGALDRIPSCAAPFDHRKPSSHEDGSQPAMPPSTASAAEGTTALRAGDQKRIPHP